MSSSHVLTVWLTWFRQGAETGGSGTLHHRPGLCRRTEASRSLGIPTGSLPECLWD